ncbi:MvdC/MvdD family ATP grasp protein [Streptomyces sp. TE33382]
MTTELNRRQVPVVRLDPADFPADITVAARLGTGGLHGTLRTVTRRALLDHVRAVYWRRPRPYTAPPGLDEQTARWCREEARFGLGGILTTLPPRIT